MIKRFRDAFTTGLADEVVDSAVRRGMHDVLTALDNVVDNESVLDQVFASVGRATPGQPRRQQEDKNSSAADEVCSRIAMLESVIATAVKKGTRASFVGTTPLAQARRFLFELRRGLERRTATAEDAFRLLNVITHTLHEADTALRRQESMGLKQPFAAQVSDLRKLTEDIVGTFEEIAPQVMRLFGYSSDSSPILVPQP